MIEMSFKFQNPFRSNLNPNMSTPNLPQVVTVRPIENKENVEKGKVIDLQRIKIQIKWISEPPAQLYETFHEAIGPVLLFAQFFGCVPCENILQKDEKKIEFRWKSLRTIYSFLFFLFAFIELVVGSRRLFRRGFYNIHFAEGYLFLLTAIIKFTMMFRLGRNWQKIMVKWRDFENPFLHHPYEFKGMKLKVKIRIVGTFFIILLLGRIFLKF